MAKKHAAFGDSSPIDFQVRSGPNNQCYIKWRLSVVIANMRLVQNKTWLFLRCLLLLGTMSKTMGQSTFTSGLVIQTQVSFNAQGFTQTNVAMTVNQIKSVKDFFVSQIQKACANTECGDFSQTVVVVPNSLPVIGTNDVLHFIVTISIALPDNTRSAIVKQSGVMASNAIDIAVRDANPGFVFFTYSEVYRVDRSRPVVCGDGSLFDAEACDDGNTVNGDGCSSTCTLEPGFMCFGAWRDASNISGRGKMTVWTTQNGNPVLTILAQNEGCIEEDICEQHNMPWRPLDWTSTYTPGVLLPPLGFYCKRFCSSTFTAAPLYEFNNSCVPTGVDECSRGESNCDPNAYCTEPVNGVGYSCECDSKYFVSTANGLKCGKEGVELTFHIAGVTAAGLAPDTAGFDTQLAEITAVRLKLIGMLIDDNIIRSALSRQNQINLALEGILQYPIALKTASVGEGPLVGRPLWQVILRVPDSHLNLELVATKGNIFDNATTFATLFTPGYELNTVGQCSNDRARTCSVADNTCLGRDIPCIPNRPDFTVSKLFAGGSAAPLPLGSSGLDVMSVDYDITQSAFNIRMRYDNTLASVIDTVYVSHMGKNQDPLFLPTFNSDEFPCLPLGTALFQNQRDSSGTLHACICPCAFQNDVINARIRFDFVGVAHSNTESRACESNTATCAFV